jgi:hypothetical protein
VQPFYLRGVVLGAPPIVQCVGVDFGCGVFVMSHTFFKRVPDNSDASFDPHDPRQVAEAKFQRVREQKIAHQEVCFARAPLLLFVEQR